MSVFGGDSWAIEAQYRKRRVDDLLADDSSFKKLSNGKYACVVCPNNPVLDSPHVFPMHRNGSRHRAAESRLKEKELNKRMAVSHAPSTGQKSFNHHQNVGSTRKTLIEQRKQLASKIQLDNIQLHPIEAACKTDQLSAQVASAASDSMETSSCSKSLSVESDKMGIEQCLYFRERRERELKFTAAGWKRDCHGQWYKDENAEFDSDEEDPNVRLI